MEDIRRNFELKRSNWRWYGLSLEEAECGGSRCPRGCWGIGPALRAKTQIQGSHEFEARLSGGLNQIFSSTRPGQAWVTDITYVSTGDGWLYVAGIKDVVRCAIVGYAMGARMTQALTAQALRLTARNKRPAADLIHHSDREQPVLCRRRPEVGQTVRHAAFHVTARELPR